MENIAITRALAGSAALALTLTGCSSGSAEDSNLPRATADDTHLAALTHALNETGFEVWRASLADGENTLISPASISTAFGMVAAGASDPVDAALADLFGYPVDGEALLEAFNAYEQAITREYSAGGEGEMEGPQESATVEVANRIWVTEGFVPRESYTQQVARYFGAAADQLPMQDDPEASARVVNDWVDERTHGLIPTLVDEDFFAEDTVMALVNALYLKAEWQEPFETGLTRDEDFTLLDGSTVSVPMMHQAQMTGAAFEGENFVAASIPYAYGELDMVIVVPDEGAYEQVEASLGQDLLDTLDSTQPGVFDLAMPRFEAESRTDLRSAIEGTLGVADLFGTVGLDGIAPELYVDSAVHAATITVDEAGTEAAAATGISVGLTSAPPQPDLTVRADRPFLYLIRDLDTGAVLFVGRMLDPSAG